MNVRLLSATHRDLEAAIAEGKFRRDLFHRLNRVTLRLPPLRERLEDLPDLAAYFLARAAEGTGRSPPGLDEAAAQRLRAYHWPGNIRELQNVLHRAVGVCRGPLVAPAHLDFSEERCAAVPATEGGEAEAVAGLRQAVRWAWGSGEANLWPKLQDLLERELLTHAAAALAGNKTQIAERLNMSRGTVIKRLQAHGLE